MKPNAGFPIAAFLLLIGGCAGSGGSDDSSKPQSGGSGAGPSPPVLAACEAGDGRGSAHGGIWVENSEGSESEEMRLLVAETGEFRWTSPKAWYQQIFGSFQVGDFASDDAVYVSVDALVWSNINIVAVDVDGELDPSSNLSLRLNFDSTFSDDTRLLAPCNSVYARGSSLESIAGTYVNGSLMLAIDEQGEIFLQDGECVGDGSVELIDPDFNMYRMELTVGACDNSEGFHMHAVDSTFNGLAYLGNSGPGFIGDALEWSLNSGDDESIPIWSGHARK